MSRSLRGNLRGSAARLDKQEILTEMMIQSERDAAKRHRFHVQYMWTLRRLKRMDPDWESWYNGRPEIACGEMLPLMKQRIEEINHET
jgi:hypothetical protein